MVVGGGAEKNQDLFYLHLKICHRNEKRSFKKFQLFFSCSTAFEQKRKEHYGEYMSWEEARKLANQTLDDSNEENET